MKALGVGAVVSGDYFGWQSALVGGLGGLGIGPFSLSLSLSFSLSHYFFLFHLTQSPFLCLSHTHFVSVSSDYSYRSNVSVTLFINK